ncbi:hypothetical protein HanRHA438_Chr05g0213971 [Helianthus annuus]|nr:hypothetical protein HanRHA438_Chr05g0213971 [Helianthus annuus]
MPILTHYPNQPNPPILPLLTIRSLVRFPQRGFFPDLLGFLLNWCIGIIA